MTVLSKTRWGPFGYQDMDDEPSDDYRREVIGGSLYVSPARNTAHLQVVANVASVLRCAATGASSVLAAPFDWRHPDGGVVQPDLVVVGGADFDGKGPLPPSALPFLVVEVLSPTIPEYALALKRELYEGLAVPAYWVIDPDRLSVLALRLTGGSYATEAEIGGDDEFVVDFPFAIRFRPVDLAAMGDCR